MATPSLLLIPDRYKASKLYSQIPDSGAGDLAFTRANDTATRVNSAGLIEKVRTNLVLHSQDFANAAWVKDGVTLTAGQTDPNGGTLGFLSTSTSAVEALFYQANAGARAFSIFAKAGTRNNFSIINGAYNNGASFNLATQTATSAGQGTLAKIESVGGGWFRCSVFMLSASNIVISNSNLAGSDNVIGDSLSYAFAQSETGDIATDYIPTTTAAVSVGPVANIPRIDYTGGGCGKLLLEPQRTNLFNFSEQLDNAYWTKYGGQVITVNNAVSLDGFTSADKMSASGGVFTNAAFTASTAFAISAFIKKDTATSFTIEFTDQGGPFAGGGIVYTFSTNAISIIQSANGSVSGEAVSYGNGWIRLILKMTANAATNFNYQQFNFGGGTGWAWGFQMEQGSYPTSYIPTLGASVTRSADAASKTGISSLIGATEGTLFYDGFFGNEAIEVYLFLQNAASSGVDNSIFLQRFGTGISLNVYTATAQVLIIGGDFTIGQHVKIAAAYKANDFVLYVNGVQIGTDNSGSVPTCDTLQLASYRGLPVNAEYIAVKGTNTAALYPVRLSNSNLALLTTL